VHRSNRDGLSAPYFDGKSAVHRVQAWTIIAAATEMETAGQVLFQGTDAVLANGGHEPLELTGLESIAAGVVVSTGGSGEDHAGLGYNALVLETEDP